MTTVRSGLTDRIIPCCWSDCDRAGHKEYEFVPPYDGKGKILHYPFCSERHRALYINSHRANNQLASGSKSLLPPK